MRVILPMLVLAAAPILAAATVETASGDWSRLPKLAHRGSDHLQPRTIVAIQSVAKEENCRLPGQSRDNLDMHISFAAQFSPSGGLDRVLMPRLNCPRVEGALGGVLVEMINAGDYRPTGKNSEGWYRGDLDFEYQE